MLVLPAIDILDGKCVRLTKGDYNAVRQYSDSPVEVAKDFEKQGAKFLHVVDLDGAKGGSVVNQGVIMDIVEAVDIPVQVGGGIRSFKDSKGYLDAGVSRVIFGTAAISDTNLIRKLVRSFGSDCIFVSLDFRDGKLAIEGWTEDSEQSTTKVLKTLLKMGVKTVVVTDVSRDGTLSGMDLSIFKKVIKFGFNVIAAGGVSSFKDLEVLRDLEFYGAISGKAIYEGRIDLASACGSPLAKRIIPCMDIDNGRVVKGTNFKNLRDAGDAVELAKVYDQMGADELVFLDITATVEQRKTLVELVSQISKNISIPFTVGGGIRSVCDIRDLLNAGADKISLGSIAISDPKIVTEASDEFGSQCIVISLDCKRDGNSWKLFTKGGREKTDLDAVEFASLMEKVDAGELLVNSLDRDGMKNGYDLELLTKISEVVNIPVIASSGAGCREDFLKAFDGGRADGALAASLFHYGEINIRELKRYLSDQKVTIRL
jgi:imidazole glycerol-phosphate synthase subunit HisF